jgi:hypothetical protein
MLYVPNHWLKVALRVFFANWDGLREELAFFPEQRSGEPWAECHGDVKFL